MPAFQTIINNAQTHPSPAHAGQSKIPPDPDHVDVLPSRAAVLPRIQKMPLTGEKKIVRNRARQPPRPQHRLNFAHPGIVSQLLQHHQQTNWINYRHPPVHRQPRYRLPPQLIIHRQRLRFSRSDPHPHPTTTRPP